MENSGRLAVIRDANGSFWFRRVLDNYIAEYGSKNSLTHPPGSDILVFEQVDGVRLEFHDFVQTTYPQGALLRVVEPGNTSIEVQSYTSTGQIEEVHRSGIVGGETLVEAFVYTYHPSTEDVASVTLRRKLGTGGWLNVSRATYSYYDGSTANGSISDLELVQIEEPTSSGWAVTQSMYYRYYKDGDVHGFAHGMKYVVEPGSFQRMVDNSIDPLTASDVVLSMFADNYFRYDSQKRVVLERVNAGSLEYALSYTSGNITFSPNEWVTKTIVTNPDGTSTKVYTNKLGQPLIRDFTDGTNHWITASHYDADHRLLWQASPSAVESYNDSFADLSIVLKSSDGFITTMAYYSVTGGGAAAGYLASTAVRQGQSGALVPQAAYEYSTRTAGAMTIHPVTKVTQYRNSDGTGLQETSTSHTWYDDAVQVKLRSTAQPVVPTSQNGNGVAGVIQEYFDDLGQLTWIMDQRGYISHMVYDLATGAMIQQIQDVNTTLVSGAPAGWTTPAGGGLNLVTDMTPDDLGRTIMTLGPVHSIDLGGTATEIRTASYTVFDDVNHIVYQASGWLVPATEDYFLVNPVSITLQDAGGKVLEQIQAAASTTTGSLAEYVAATNSGGTTPLGGFPQSTYTRWTTFQYTDCCLLESQRVYHTIPASGIGASGTNYDQTTYGYDVMKRRNRTVTPGGTITFLVYDARGLVSATYVGTNDDGATDQDPTGGGVDPDNNMVLVTENVYDGGVDGGDGNLTQQTQHVDAATTRVTNYGYDWRNRRVTTDGEIDLFVKLTYNNLNQITLQQQYDTTASGPLVAQSETKYDNRGRTYRTIRYGVDPATGTVGNSLSSEVWYDLAENVIKSWPAGSELFTKSTYDGVGRVTAQYQGYGDDPNYAAVLTVINNTIMEQSETTYDAASNILSTTAKQRYHDAVASQTGALGDPQTSPKARVSYSAQWADAIGRSQAIANYGTNGGTSFTRPGTVPSRSDTVLVTSQTYDEAGSLFETTDPASMVTRFGYDDAGRRIQVIENYVTSPSSDDENRTTNMTYGPDGQLSTLVAVNASTGNQTTTYTYGTTLDDSDVASSLLLRSVAYPDSSSGSDQVFLTYNRQGQRTSLTDQLGTVHEYAFDLLGRLRDDAVTTLASGVDGAVRRLEKSYDVRGLVHQLTSYDAATSGSAVNQVQFSYNDFGQSIQTFQEHAGVVDTGTTPSVQMGYANGSANTVRQQTLTYPNGRELTYDYGTSGGMNDALSRIGSIIDDDSTHLVDYDYLGLGSFVQQTSPQPSLRYTLVGSSNDPDTGDIYTGLDRFGRVKDSRWYDTSTNEDLSRIQYGYDRASNRIWRKNPVATANSAEYDWLYTYDGLQRLKTAHRGTLNGTQTALTSTAFEQDWSLDPTGNWEGFKQSDNGSTWSMEQERTANPVNEITDITNTVGSPWADPAYNAVGNMTTIPKPKQMDEAYTATYDAWNRLVKLEEEVSSTLETVAEYQYDARNFRIVVKNYGSGPLDETIYAYFTDRWRCVEERLGETPELADPIHQSIWGLRYIDNLILRQRSTTATLDEHLYALQDDNWNVTTLIDDAGDVQERFEYDPYGPLIFLTPAYEERLASLFDWGVLYAGYRRDTRTGLDCVRNRFYDPILGSWLNRDPIGPRDFLNLYEYCLSNPLSRIDPQGTQDQLPAPITDIYSNPSLPPAQSTEIYVPLPVNEVFGPTIADRETYPVKVPFLPSASVTINPIEMIEADDILEACQKSFAKRLSVPPRTGVKELDEYQGIQQDPFSLFGQVALDVGKDVLNPKVNIDDASPLEILGAAGLSAVAIGAYNQFGKDSFGVKLGGKLFTIDGAPIGLPFDASMTHYVDQTPGQGYSNQFGIQLDGKTRAGGAWTLGCVGSTTPVPSLWDIPRSRDAKSLNIYFQLSR